MDENKVESNASLTAKAGISMLIGIILIISVGAWATTIFRIEDENLIVESFSILSYIIMAIGGSGAAYGAGRFGMGAYNKLRK